MEQADIFIEIDALYVNNGELRLPVGIFGLGDTRSAGQNERTIITFPINATRARFPALAVTDAGVPRIYLDNPAVKRMMPVRRGFAP